MTLRKKILFYTLLTLFTLAAVEGMARLAYYLAFAESSSSPPTLSSETADLDPGQPPVLTRNSFWNLERAIRISHPYHGFTDHSPNAPLNAMPPPQTGPDTVVIGLLGGSVAREVAPYLQQALTRHFAAQNLAKEPVVVPLAANALKQPQQLHIANFMLTMGGNFDLLVNLDGYNELEGAYTNFDNAVFPFFPYQWEKLVFLTREEIALAGQIHAARAQLAQLQQAAPVSPFRHTAIYGILHRYQTQQAETRILQLNYELATQGSARSLEQQGPYVPFQDTTQVHQEAVRVWYRSSLLLSRLAAAAGADYYHFLQPNLYIPNTKPLSPQEQQELLNPARAAQSNFPETYPQFVQFGQELQQHGVNYFDLTLIFNDHPETLYRDDCCHLNQRGYELLAAAMVAPLTPALRRRAAAPAPQPDGDLTVAAPLLLPPAPPTPPAVPAAAAAAEPGFQVSRRPGNLLVYVKPACAPEHTAAPFFLHFTPGDLTDLPPDRRRYGFASRDFSFSDAVFRSGSWFGQQCVIEIPLPDYPIVHLRTGQYNRVGEIWATELTFSE